MEIYGTKNPLHPETELIEQSGVGDGRYIIYHPLIPMWAKPCQWPGSIKVQIVKHDGTVIGATRLLDDSVRFDGC